MANEAVTKTKDGEKVTVDYDFGGDTASAVTLFGEAAVYGKFHARSKADLQTLLGRLVEAGKSNEDIGKIVADWQPGKRVYTAPSLSSFSVRFKELPKEQQAEVLARAENLVEEAAAK